MKHLKIGTFNLKNNIAKPTSLMYWERRVPFICKLIEEEHPDILGTQECSPEMLQYLKDTLQNYTILQVSRDQKHEDDNPILVCRDSLAIKQSGIFSLSDQPDVPYTKNITSVQPRKCSFVTVTDGTDIVDFYNTHLDFLVPMARSFQLQVISNQMRKHRNPFHSQILVGDFNMSYHHSIQAFEIETGLSDIIPSSFGSTLRQLPWRKSIDHILIDPKLQVESICKNGQTYNGIKPSDHCAVFTKVKKKTNR